MTNTHDASLYECLGQHIRTARRKKGISGRQLGKKVDISQQQISRYERGVNKLELDTLIKIFKKLDIESDDILNILNTVIKNQLGMQNSDIDIINHKINH